MSTHRQRRQLKAKRSRKQSRQEASLGMVLDRMIGAGAEAGQFCQTGPNGKPVFVEFFPAERLDEFDDVKGIDS